MKICWDNLDGIKYSKKTGLFRFRGRTYHYCESCNNCKDSFLGLHSDSNCCSKSCAKTGENHPFYGLLGENSPYYGKRGKDTPGWKGGYATKKIPMYDTYAPQLEPYEECRRKEEDPNILEVKCTYCGKWHTPTIGGVCGRISGINSNDIHKFYCSPECKSSCPLFRMSAESIMKDDAIAAGRITLKELRNEVPKWIRDKVLELDDHTCQMCGSKDKLHVHHEIPQKRNQMLALDIENCISLCENCHKWVHTQIDGCRYHELADLELC